MIKTKTHFLQDITKEYRKNGEAWPTTSKDIAAWAIRKKMWAPHPRSLIDQCASEISAAMREEMFTDPQGRHVRKKHSLRDVRELPDGTFKQLPLWVDIEDANAEEMEMAFQQRRMQVLGDCRQLKVDVDSYNDNNKNDDFIQVCFDFTDDLNELEQAAEYPGV